MKTSKTLFAAGAALTTLTAVALSLVPAGAQTPGAALNIQYSPAPGYGTTSTYNVAVSVRGKPLKGVQIIHWFSGKHSVESQHYTATTNAQGVATFLDAIPRDWKPSGTWVDLDVSCPTVGLQKHWRVRN